MKAVNVVLVLPPLVETNFGQIYPSTAVLAAYLQPRGFPAIQVDLNAAFFHHLVSDDELAASAAGLYARSSIGAIAAARWTRLRLESGSLTRPEMFAAQRKNPLNAVVRLLVVPYSVDPDSHVLAGSSGDPRLDASYDRFFASHVSRLAGRERQATLFALSVPMGPQLLPALRLSSILAGRVHGSHSRIVLGGPALSLLGDAELTCLLEHNPAVDCIVRFDGEGPLHALAEQMAAGEWAPERVPAASSLYRSTPYHIAPAPGPSLDTLPTPLYSDALLARAPQARLGVLQARGCYWGKCDYCDFVEVYKGSPPYRSRAVDLVVADMRHLVERTGIRRFRVITESIPPAFARALSERLCREALGVQWSSFIMVDRRFDRELLRLMAASGCDLLVVGLESMVTRALKLVHKAADREENIRFLADARAAGIVLHVNLIPDLPSTTRQEALSGLADLESVMDCMSEANVIPFEATRSSRVGRAPSQFGLIAADAPVHSGHAQLALNTLQATDPAMTGAERAEVFRAYREFEARVNARVAGPNHAPGLNQYTVFVDGPEAAGLFHVATLEYLAVGSLSSEPLSLKP
jgi:hypothetical protein